MPRPTPTVVPELWDKLDRAYEHVDELKVLVGSFVTQPDRFTASLDKKERDAFYNRLKTTPIPSQIPVVCGEVFYQLRSTLDHFIARLVEFENGPNSVISVNQFPVIMTNPATDRKAKERWQGQIKGIERADVLAFLDSYQPYHRTDPKGHWLYVISDKHNSDKHRRLSLLVQYGQRTLRISGGTFDTYLTGPSDGTEPIPIPSENEVYVEDSLTVYVAFEHWTHNAGVQTEVVDILGTSCNAIADLITEGEKYLA